MNIKHLLCILLAVIFAVTCLAGCAKDEPVPTDADPAVAENTESSAVETGTEYTASQESDPIEAATEDIYVTEEPNSETTNDSMTKAKINYNKFALQFAKTLNEGKEQNFLCSPLSAWLPLAALYNATDWRGQPDLGAAIGISEPTPASTDPQNVESTNADDLNVYVKALMDALTCKQMNEWREAEGLEPLEPLQLANALFLNEGSKLNADFEKILADVYDGIAMNVDFASQDAVNTVNEWADEHTHGMIPKIIEQFTPGTVAAIANALYFRDRWEWEFEEEDTEVAIFNAPGPVGPVEVPFMEHVGPDQMYFEDFSVKAMRLDFQNEGEMLILLPKDKDTKDLLDRLSPERMDAIMNGMEKSTGTFKMPKFNLSADAMDLIGTLEALGVPLFDSSDALINGVLEHGDLLFISQAVQSARIEVDENGTTAAAVTMMAVDATGILMPEEQSQFEMICDRPFVFILYGDGPEGEHPILFTGILADPSYED